jgi:hypothetical protein
MTLQADKTVALEFLCTFACFRFGIWIELYIKGIIELKYCIVGSKPVSKFEMGFFFEIEFNYQCTARVLQLSVKKCLSLN